MPGQTGPLALVVNFGDPSPARPAFEALRDAGFALAEAPTVEAALARAAPPDLVVLAAPPGPDAAGLCRRLKADPATAAAPLLCLSDGAAERTAALGAGADACLPASAGADELAAASLALWRTAHAASEALRRTREQFRSLTDRVPVLLACCDSEARYLFVNEGYAARFGLRPPDVVGRHIAEVVGGAAYERLRHHVEAALAGERVEFEEEVPYERIGPRFMRCAYAPEVGPDGRVCGLVATISDVTARRRAEGALRQSEGRFRALATHAPVGIFLTDAEGRCQMVNDRWCALAGVTPEQAQGHGWLEALHPEDRDRVAREWYEAASHGREFASQYRFRTPGGRVSWLAGRAAALRDEAGRVTGHIGTLTDITALKRAEEELRRAEAVSRSVLDHVLDGILTIDEAGVVGSLNPAAQRLFGYDAAEVIGRNVNVLMPEPYHSQHDRYVADYLRTGQAKVIGVGREVVGRRKDGSTFPMDLAVSEFRLGERRFFTGIVRDITERKRLEGELKRRAEELERADRRKDEFLAMLAHEMRGPLAPLTNALHLMRLRGGDAEAVEQASALAERQVRQLARLVDDLLDVSRVAQGRLQIVKERVEVASVVAQAVETARPLFEARGHELNVLLPPEPVALEADAARLVQVLSNLLTNAARYTPAGGKVWLGVERDGPDVLFRVRDTGVGLTPEMLPRVFELFTQAQPGAQGGLGVGLALVRGLAELHGGSVLAYSDGPGEGSEFVVRLPGLPPPAPAAPKPRPQWAAAGEPRRVLVVDDNIDAAESLAQLLRLGGHEVLVAHDGVSALEAARLNRPEVVFLDIGLPGGLDGHQVARLLRREQGLEGVLLVALTGFGQEEDRRCALEAGCDHFLVKPVEVQALVGLLACPAGEHQQAKERRSAPRGKPRGHDSPGPGGGESVEAEDTH